MHAPIGDVAPKPDMMRRLRQTEAERLAADLSRRLNASYLPAEPGRQIAGIYELSITTPTGKVAARTPPQPPRNKGKLTGPKPPLRPGRVWSIRAKLQLERRSTSPATASCAAAIWWRCVSMTWPPRATPSTAQPSGKQDRAGPSASNSTEVTRHSLDDYLRATGRRPGRCLFLGRRGPDEHLTTCQYARLVSEWSAAPASTR